MTSIIHMISKLEVQVAVRRSWRLGSLVESEKDEARNRSAQCICCAPLTIRRAHSHTDPAKYVRNIAGVSSRTMPLTFRR